MLYCRDDVRLAAHVPVRRRHALQLTLCCCRLLEYVTATRAPSYAIYLHVVNDKAASGQKAAVRVRLEGYHAYAPQRIPAESPWLEPFSKGGSQVMRAGGRLGGTVATADVGRLTRLRLRAPKKLLRAVSLVEVVRGDSGEVAFFALAASKRAAELLAADGEVLLTREPLNTPLYRYCSCVAVNAPIITTKCQGPPTGAACRPPPPALSVR